MNIYEKKFFAALDKVIAEATIKAPDPTVSGPDISGVDQVTDMPPELNDETRNSDINARNSDLTQDSIDKLGQEEQSRVDMQNDGGTDKNIVKELERIGRVIQGYKDQLSDILNNIIKSVNEAASDKCAGKYQSLVTDLNLSDDADKIINCQTLANGVLSHLIQALTVGVGEKVANAQQKEAARR